MTEAPNSATERGTRGATEAAVREHRAWHAARERALRAPHGPLSHTALHWPTARPGRLPGLPGEWWVTDGTLFTRQTPGDGAVLTGEDVEPDGLTAIGVAEGRSRILGTFVPEGRAPVGPGLAEVPTGAPAGVEQEVAVEVIRRTGRYAVRPHDPQAATRAAFDGVRVYGYAPSWVLYAPVRWYDEPEPVTVGAAQPRLVHHVEAVGEVDIAHGETVTTLVLTGSRAEPTLLFSDEADDVAPWRVLRPAAPGAGRDGGPDDGPATSGTVRLDLNRTENLPYAFTDFGTCPAPLAGNHLPFAVTAGERAPR